MGTGYTGQDETALGVKDIRGQELLRSTAVSITKRPSGQATIVLNGSIIEMVQARILALAVGGLERPGDRLLKFHAAFSKDL